MCIHHHKDKSYTLDQHCYVLNTLQHFNSNSEFPERETPSPPDYTFSKDNQPVTDHDKHIIKEQHKCLPFRSAICMLLNLAYNTRANILFFAVCKLAKAYICPGKTDFLCNQVLPRHHFQPCLQRMPPTPHTTLQPDRILRHQLARLPRHWPLYRLIYDLPQWRTHRSQFYHANTDRYVNL